MRETWRGEAIIGAMGHFWKDIEDGTPEGNRYIGETLFPLGGNPPDPDYRNGKTSWCGRFVEAVFWPLGFRFSLDSVGRVLSYAHYNTGVYSMAGAPDCCKADGKAMSLMSYHGNNGRKREIFPAWDCDPLPGDIALHQNSPGSWHGHIMMVLNVNEDTGDITVIEGNHSKTYGPTRKQRDGIGTRTIGRGDEYLTWIVRPSAIDFDWLLEIGSASELKG